MERQSRATALERTYVSITYKEFTAKLAELEEQGRFFNDLGKEIAWDLCRTDGLHRLLLGGTGWGKTFIVQTVMKILGNPFVAVNAHPGMDIRDLVGQWRPSPVEGGGVTIEWQDGAFTNAVREGKTFMLEEATRGPQEFMSRMYGVMDSVGAYWSLPENGETQVPVSDKFSVIATANPPGKGYLSQNLDKAFLRRFKWVRTVDQPLADEEKALTYILGDGATEQSDRVKRFTSWVDDAREATSTNINTGDLAAAAEMTMRGFTPLQAIEYTITPKYGEVSALLTGARAHFDTGSNKVLVGNSAMFPNNAANAPAPKPKQAAPQEAKNVAATIAKMTPEEILQAISGIPQGNK